MSEQLIGISLGSPKQRYSPNRNADDIAITQRVFHAGEVIRAPLYPHAVEFSHRLRSSHWYSTEFSPHMQIVLLGEGKLRYRCENRSFLIGGRRILVIPPGRAFRFETVPGGGYRKAVLFVNGVNLPGIMETLSLEKCTAIDLPETETVERYFKSIYDLLEIPEESRLPALAAQCFELLHYLSAFLTRSNNASSLLFQLIKNQMQSDFSRGGEVNALARKFKVSTRTIRRMFHANLGMTPIQYHRECRFRAACELLAMTRLSMKEIADHLGYSSQFHFSREFRNQAGLPPRAWRMEHRTNED